MAETTSTNFNGGAVAPGSGGLVLSFVSKVTSIPYVDFDGTIEFSGSVENFSGHCEISIKPTTTEYAHVIAYTRATKASPWVIASQLTFMYPNMQSHITIPIAVNGVAEIKVTLSAGPLDASSNIIGYLKGFEFKE